MEGDFKKDFEKYLEENEGQPIDPEAVVAGKKEMKAEKKGGFAVYGDEPSKESKGIPSKAVEELKNMVRRVNELYRTGEGLNKRELISAIADLKNLKLSTKDFLEEKKTGKLTNNKIMNRIVTKLRTKYSISGQLEELPEAIDSLLTKYNKALEDISNRE